MKRQQQSLLRELLELISSGTSELASLLVKQGLLIHDLSPSCSSRMPSNDFLEYRNSSDFEGVLQSRSSCDNLGTAVKHENNSVAAWKHTCVQLAYHMPQLPSLLLSSIIETLATMSHNSSSKMESKENTVAFMSKEDLLEWATWMLDQSSALSKKKKSPSGISDFIETSANVQMHADFPQDSLKELGHLCLRSKIDKACLVELVSRISALVNEGSFRRCAKVLERCSPSCSVGGNFQDVGVDVNMKEVGRNFVGHESVRYGNHGVAYHSQLLVLKRTISIPVYLSTLLNTEGCFVKCLLCMLVQSGPQSNISNPVQTSFDISDAFPNPRSQPRVFCFCFSLVLKHSCS